MRSNDGKLLRCTSIHQHMRRSTHVLAVGDINYTCRPKDNKDDTHIIVLCICHPDTGERLDAIWRLTDPQRHNDKAKRTRAKYSLR